MMSPQSNRTQVLHVTIFETIEQESQLHTYTNTSFQLRGSLCHPFVDKIMNVELLVHSKGFNLDRCDATTDLDEHIDIHVTQMSLYTIKDAIFCQVFPTSLKGTALSWFTCLPPLSIDTFETLLSKFGTQFAISRPQHVIS